jgi:cation diffusion facilitator family transporter
MFLVGGAVSVWEGINALLEPRELDYFWVGVGVLTISLLFDGISRVVAVHQLRMESQRRGISLRAFLNESTDPALTTVYLEDTVDVLGATLALAALVLHKTTGVEWADGLATVLIGLLLAFLATRLARRNRELITNQAVPARYVERLRTRLDAQPGIAAVPRLEADYIGASDVLVAADVLMEPGLDSDGAAQALAAARTRIQQEVPVVARLYLTPVPRERE